MSDYIEVDLEKVMKRQIQMDSRITLSDIAFLMEMPYYEPEFDDDDSTTIMPE